MVHAQIEIQKSSSAIPRYWRIIRLLYNISFPFVLALLLPGYLLRMMRRGDFRRDFGQRLGRFSPAVRARLSKGHWIWMHAVSVGEVFIALKLARKMKEHQPELQVVLSTTTTTGRAMAEGAKLDWVQVIYNPIDFSPAIRSTLNLIRPRALILVEAEVWPNLVSEAQRRGIPIALVNARLSPRSERRYRAARFLVAPLFNHLDLICVQEVEDVEKWKSFGVRWEKIHQVGSIKFDDQDSTVPQPRDDFRRLLAELGVSDSAPILVAGSTHPGEELILAGLVRELKPSYPNLFLILVPRHVERSKDIAQELAANGYRVAMRNEPPTAKSTGPLDGLLVNTTGELRDWYSLATVVFIGKSLTSHGGQNPVEPINAGKPVLFGPHMENFAAIERRLKRVDATIPIQTGEDLKDALRDLLANPSLREELAVRAAEVVAYHRGATERTRALLALH